MLTNQVAVKKHIIHLRKLGIKKNTHPDLNIKDGFNLFARPETYRLEKVMDSDIFEIEIMFVTLAGG